MNLTCPVCQKDDAVRCKDEPRFYRDGRLVAICFHGHGNGRPCTFDAETGATIDHKPLEPFELLYREAEEATQARGFGGSFLGIHCGIFALTREAIAKVCPIVPTERDWVRAQEQEGALTVAPLFHGAAIVGLECRIVEAKSIATVSKWTRTLGADGIYIANPGVQPAFVIVFEGTWDAVSALWDAYNHDEVGRYAFMSIKAGTTPEMLRDTLEAHFPGIPALLVSDQDSAGKGARVRLRTVLTPAILPGVGVAKDYRASDPKKRWDALLEAIETAINAPASTGDQGLAKIARRALLGSMKARSQGLANLEAWRYGQRCAGICRPGGAGGKRYFAVRARVHGRLPVAEGLHDFVSILTHPEMRRVRADFFDLASVIEGGATESVMSPEWKPPAFLEDGRHWSEIPARERTSLARNQGWEPWSGKEVGVMRPDDLQTLLDHTGSGYAFVTMPGAPDSEVGSRVAVICLAVALTAFWAEERWQTGLPVGFLPAVWFFGGPATGKGTAAKVIAAATTGELRTYGSQRFDGGVGGWLTESVFHTPVCFRDELDQFLQHGELEDFKTYIAGEPLQLRKKFGSDMTVPPKPVVFASNSLKINADDEATKERIVLQCLEPNLLAPKTTRNAAFATYYAWLEKEGAELLHRLSIGLYKSFRAKPLLLAPRWTRSLSFDSAVIHVSEAAGYDPENLMAPAQAEKEQAIQRAAPWFEDLRDFVRHELDGLSYQETPVLDVWGIDKYNPTESRKLRRWIEQFQSSAKQGSVLVEGWRVTLGGSRMTTKRTFLFQRQEPTP